MCCHACISVSFCNLLIISCIQSGSRLFGFVGAGATFGQLFGSLFASAMAWLGPCMCPLVDISNSINMLFYCNFIYVFVCPDLLLIASLLMELAAQSSERINKDMSHSSEEVSPLR